MVKDIKSEVAARAAAYLRALDKHDPVHIVDGQCVYCCAQVDELHEPSCPVYKEEGLRMCLNKLFYGITDRSGRENNPAAL